MSPVRHGALATLLVTLITALPWQAAAAPLVAQPLAPGVHAVLGGTGAVDAANRGHLGNSGFIATPAGTVVVNTGGSYGLGRELLALAERTTGQPVIAAIVAQARPEFLMGNAAFDDRGIELVAHEATARLIAQRCHRCLKRLREQLGDDVMAGTRIVVPRHTVAGSTHIAPGGRRIELLFLGPAQNGGDLVVLDVQTGVAFAGALVSRGRLPELDTVGDAAPWRAALAALARLPIRTLVPAYGAPGPPAPLIAGTEHYLARLQTEVQAQVEAGTRLVDAPRALPMAGWRGWSQHARLQPANVQRQFLAAEARWAAGAPP